MPEWGRSPGWPTRNFNMRTCCSSAVRPVTSSGREYFSASLRPSRDNSACGRLRRGSQRPGAKPQTVDDINRALWCDVLVMAEHVLRVVTALQRDEPLVLLGAIYRTEPVGGLIG